MDPILFDELDRFIDEYRNSALWYIRQNYYPRTKIEIRYILSLICKQGCLQTFIRAKELETVFVYR